MISSLLKALMKECHLQQAGLAEVMGVSLDRVKSLASGKVKNLKREESQALIDKLGVRAAWLVTGEGSMFRKDETQDEFVTRHQSINRVAALVNAMPIQEITRMRLAVLMTGDPTIDGPLITEALFAEFRGRDNATGEPDRGQSGIDRPTPSTPASTGLSPEEMVLLQYFRTAPPTGRSAAMGALFGATAPAGQIMQNLSGGSHTMIGSISGTYHPPSAPGKTSRRKS